MGCAQKTFLVRKFRLFFLCPKSQCSFWHETSGIETSGIETAHWSTDKWLVQTENYASYPALVLYLQASAFQLPHLPSCGRLLWMTPKRSKGLRTSQLNVMYTDIVPKSTVPSRAFTFCSARKRINIPSVDASNDCDFGARNYLTVLQCKMRAARARLFEYFIVSSTITDTCWIAKTHWDYSQYYWL